MDKILMRMPAFIFKMLYVPGFVLGLFPTNKKHLIIKLPTPYWSIVRQWGDFYLALGLKREFQKLGYRVRIDCLNEWDKMHPAKSVVLVLRGLYEYNPRVSEKTIVWNISHPDLVKPEEFKTADFTFVSSMLWKDKMDVKYPGKVGFLDQCTDANWFYQIQGVKKEYDLLFIGNSRKIFRKVIKDILPTKYKLGIIGNDWGEFISDDHFIGGFVPNKELNFWYNKTKILLNDHWDDMRENGFVSNRIFDGLASGCIVVSDRPAGDLSRFDGLENLYFYSTAEELKELVDEILIDWENRKVLKGKVLNSFMNCAEVFDAKFNEI